MIIKVVLIFDVKVEDWKQKYARTLQAMAQCQPTLARVATLADENVSLKDKCMHLASLLEQVSSEYVALKREAHAANQAVKETPTDNIDKEH